MCGINKVLYQRGLFKYNNSRDICQIVYYSKYTNEINHCNMINC